MKVVVNATGSGFALSDAATWWCVGQGMTAGPPDGDPDFVRGPLRIEPAARGDSGRPPRWLRSHPTVVLAVETDARWAAHCPYTDLRVVELPDDVGDGWAIDASGGGEVVRAGNRRWGPIIFGPLPCRHDWTPPDPRIG